jgi:hypothetical protein
MQHTYFTKSKQPVGGTNQINHSSEQYTDNEETTLLTQLQNLKNLKISSIIIIIIAIIIIIIIISELIWK